MWNEIFILVFNHIQRKSNNNQGVKIPQFRGREFLEITLRTDPKCLAQIRHITILTSVAPP